MHHENPSLRPESARAARANWIGPARRAASVLLVALAALLGARAALAADSTPEEMKARFLFQLLKYVTWPESSGAPAIAPFVVGVVGDDALASTLRRVVDGKQAQSRPVEVKTLTDGVEAPGVHLLFIGGGDRSKLRELARVHHGQPILTVADRFEFPDLGGDVGLELVDGRVSFSISRRKSVRGDFVISSKLMRLASEVK
jgi:hypothetical protein